ncbi:ATP-binding protein [uncultured Fluviicola sp.]|uniref:ATP-binding protein n=1 Tax=uncultured Fluviicola sp. TaxID=463303 RepID=UPI0025D58A9E|nr:ATP-binding protein [uncultured Fluviicola sp.]
MEERNYEQIRKQDAAPPAGSMMESLRDLGYSTEAAVSDIIDNAIFAKATTVWINFIWDGNKSRIVFKDDGNGMFEEELIQAMRPGSQSPASARDLSDLGRFGLGLKTASLSQCRMFTVISKKKSESLTFWRWDLDYVTSPKTEGWTILNVAEKGDIELIEEMDQGTLVSWDYLDRIIELNKKKYTEDYFYLVAEKVKRHIEMVFHRYLETGKLKIIFNDIPVKAWDPFLRGETATQPFPEEIMENGSIKIKAYILPHRSKLDESVWIDNEQREGGWDALQGFYIYRNERLLLAADWLGITRKKSHYKLARIMIDLPNNVDHEWQIDIKKSRARPPLTLRPQLKAIAMSVVTQAEQIFRHRGKQIQRSLTGDFSFVWKEIVKDGRYFFRINLEHPVIEKLLNELPDKKKEIQKLLKIIEETVPGPAIIAKENEFPDNMLKPFEKTADIEIISLMKELAVGWKQQGMSDELIKRRLLMTEPFSDYQQLIETLDYE